MATPGASDDSKFGCLSVCGTVILVLAVTGFFKGWFSGKAPDLWQLTSTKTEPATAPVADPSLTFDQQV